VGFFYSAPDSSSEEVVMKLLNLWIVLFGLLFVFHIAADEVCAAKIKQGDEVKIVTPGTVARLCPHPNCGQNAHIIRIPEGTVLEVEGIMNVKSGMMNVIWLEVTYKGKRGWISIFDTDKSH
jgi:hypothetical protein